MKKFVSLLVILSFVAFLLAACGGSGTCGSSNGSGSSAGTPTVHMCGNNNAIYHRVILGTLIVVLILLATPFARATLSRKKQFFQKE